ncbi:MAG: hypothetical protein GEU74_12000 [Nitriliruptorales bacterium]|nr:hypothetical protein [Nitriliruptorales bacterium]
MITVGQRCHALTLRRRKPVLDGESPWHEPSVPHSLDPRRPRRAADRRPGSRTRTTREAPEDGARGAGHHRALRAHAARRCDPGRGDPPHGTGRPGQGVLLTYSPYNTIGDPTSSGTISGSSPYLSIGIARAHADVLGTRGSTGCWDYGGKNEQQSGVDVVRFLAGEIPDTEGNLLQWSNGNVGMTGGSYNGTTATMVAATGLPALKAIEPIAGISHWYGYAFHDGVRYFLNSEEPTDEGFDTPLVFDHGIGDTFHTDNPDSITARAGECGTVEHEMQAYSRNPDYTDFWRERDYTLEPEKWRAAALIRHGWNDYNVKQEDAIRLFTALQPFADDRSTPEREGPPVLLRMTQGHPLDRHHARPRQADRRFLARAPA